MSESNSQVIDATIPQQEYIKTLEELNARKDERLSKMSIENANLRAALNRKEVSYELATDALTSKYRMAAIRMFNDEDVVTIADDAEVVVQPNGALIAAWVAVSAIQAGVDDGSDVVPVEA